MDSSTRRQIHEVGTRYIRKAFAQLNDLKALVARIHEGDYHCLADMDHLTHQLHGTAGMFGFEKVSAVAGRINKVVKSFEVYPSKWNLVSLDLLMIELGDALYDSVNSRNRPAGAPVSAR